MLKLKKYFTNLIVILFLSCSTENSENYPNNSINNDCGSVDLTIDGVNYTYNTINMACNGTIVYISNGQILSISINIASLCPSVINDWSVIASVIEPNINQTYVPQQASFIDYQCSFSVVEQYYNYSAMPNVNINGSITITNIDYTNITIDGNVSFLGYGSVNTSTNKQINCSFTNLPFMLFET